MSHEELTAFRSTARAYVRAMQNGEVDWIPAYHDAAEIIIGGLETHGLIDSDGRVTDAGRRAFCMAEV